MVVVGLVVSGTMVGCGWGWGEGLGQGVVVGGCGRGLWSGVLGKG